MKFSTDNMIILLKNIGENLVLGRSIESSIFFSLKNLPENIAIKNTFLNMINIGYSYNEILVNFSNHTEDKNLARIWELLEKTSKLSSNEAGLKILQIVKHLEINRILAKNQNEKIKAQKYKLYFLGFISSFLLGFISGLAPLFSNFIQIIRDITIPSTTIYLMPISLFVISTFSVYFLSDVAQTKYTYKVFLLSSVIFLASYFIGKGIFSLII